MVVFFRGFGRSERVGAVVLREETSAEVLVRQRVVLFAAGFFVVAAERSCAGPEDSVVREKESRASDREDDDGRHCQFVVGELVEDHGADAVDHRCQTDGVEASLRDAVREIKWLDTHAQQTVLVRPID